MDGSAGATATSVEPKAQGTVWTIEMVHFKTGEHRYRTTSRKGDVFNLWHGFQGALKETDVWRRIAVYEVTPRRLGNEEAYRFING